MSFVPAAVRMILPLLVLALVGVAAVAPSASAGALAACPDKTWVTGVAGPNGAGQAGEDGRIVIACKTDLALVTANGALQGRIALPAGARYYDAAPSPDWSVIYVTRVTNFDPATGRTGFPEVIRIVRQGAAGSLTYAVDAAWKPARFIMAGRPWTLRARYIATDSYGDLYVSNGGWSGYYLDAEDREFVEELSPGVVVKYSPAGDVVTLFHSTDEVLGEFDTNMGLAVTRDGATIWVVEHTNARVQRWDRTATGTYRQDTGNIKSFGTKDPGNCTSPHGLLVPYDVGVDPWGSVYVATTGCRRVSKFRPDGTPVWTKAVGQQPHGISISHRGDVYAPASDQVLDADPVPGPIPALPAKFVPDNEAPVIHAAHVADPTTIQAPTVTLTATDNRGIVQMRVANETDSEDIWKAAWTPYAPTFTHRLSDGEEVKGFWLQVRDAAGNESEFFYRTTTFRTGAAGDDAERAAPTKKVILRKARTVRRTTKRRIKVRLKVTGGSRPVQMRFANENDSLASARWRPFRRVAGHRLSKHAGYKGFWVQVRDRDGQVSNDRFVRVRLY